MICNLCARKCNAERTDQKACGICQMPSLLKIAHYQLFENEEPCISINKGSGAIFFSGCNLKCIFCQNYDISTLNKGKIITVNELVDIFKELEDLGAENINLVSPTHYALQIVEALKIYKPKVPIIYNTNAYENVETIEYVAKYVDVFLPDFKYCDNNLGKMFSGVEDYYTVALKAIKKMRELKPDIYANGKILQGVIIRHMVLPLCTSDSCKVLQTIATEIPNTKVSLLAQYTPFGKACQNKNINRKITKREYDIVLAEYQRLGLDGYIQELSSAKTDYIPKFRFV